ncbi:hypothetical protein [Flavobacterium rhizosphaerae]|uniref:Uncharacterized protein n=1 Tax=Flavobacterium rhizosphaerae TaxID=3163298 RepID=A0ABW8YWS5_9FLAO
MKIKLFLIFLFINAAVWSQDLQIPNTPAFSILDYEPSAVMRPNNTKKLATDVLNSFDESGKLKMNLGMEVAPYWLKSRPQLSREEYLEAKGKQLLLQTLSLSAATVQDSVSGNNNLGVGLRIQLIRGVLTDEFEKKERDLKDKQTIMSFFSSARGFVNRGSITTKQALIDNLTSNMQRENTSPELVDTFLSITNAIKDNYDDTKESLIMFCAEINRLFAEKTNMDALAENVIELSNKRIGFSLELASAAKFQTEVHDQAFQKFGLWLNANNYFTDTDAWTLTTRFMTRVSDTTSYNMDAGIGYIKEGKDFNVSVEGMARWYRTEIPDLNSGGMAIIRVEKDFTYRLAAQASYTFTENISFNISLGKDFDDVRITNNTFFSIFGLNYSLFSKQKVTPELN